ncbi:MAG: response regulator transcription factor [Caldilineaceae bacterium]
MNSSTEYTQSNSKSNQPEHPIQILIAEDDDALRRLLCLTLKLDGYHVFAVRDGLEALQTFEREKIDFVLLDIAMPNLDGFEACTELRKRTDVPIIIITANSRTDDMVTGIELGADHYMVKPFVLKELRARIRAILRRVRMPDAHKPGKIVTHGDITVNEELQQVTVAGEVVNLTPNEFRMLNYLMHNPDKPISKEEFLRAVWQYHPHDDVSFVRVTMRRLRSKVEKDPSNPQYLKTVHGLGYQFCSKTATAASATTATTANFSVPSYRSINPTWAAV